MQDVQDLGDTTIDRPRAAPADAPGLAPAASWAQEDTIATLTVRPAAGAASPAAPAPPGGRPVHRLRIPGGAIVPIDTSVIVGRDPAPPRVVVGPAPRLVRVVSPELEVSATHVELRQVGEKVVVTDLRSTNGTTVHAPGSSPQRLLAGGSAVVSAGGVIDLGDGVHLEVLAPREAGAAEDDAEDAGYYRAIPGRLP